MTGWSPIRETLTDWIACLLTLGSAWNDAVLATESHRRAAASEDLAEIAELAEALAGSKQRHMETMLQGAGVSGGRRPVARFGKVRAARELPLLRGLRRRSRQAWHRSGSRDFGFPAGLRFQPASGRDPVVGDWPDGRCRHPCRTGASGLRDRGQGGTFHARMISVRPPSWLKSRQCGTKRSIRGCSGHDHVAAVSLRSTKRTVARALLRPVVRIPARDGHRAGDA